MRGVGASTGHIIILINISHNFPNGGGVKRGKICLVVMGYNEVSNLSLSRVLVALNTPKQSHVPYRETKFTRYIYIYICRILQDMIGGNSETGIVLCVNPR